MIIQIVKSKDRIRELFEYSYNGYEIVIVKYKHAFLPKDLKSKFEKMGFSDWYCGYVILPLDHQFYKKQYDDIPIETHGGLTFGDYFHVEESKHYKKFAIGWDYNHGWDHGGNLDKVSTDCKSVIDQLRRFDFDY